MDIVVVSSSEIIKNIITTSIERTKLVIITVTNTIKRIIDVIEQIRIVKPGIIIIEIANEKS